MSIHQLNKLFQHKGCNIVISIVLLASVATFIGGYNMRGCGPNQSGPNGNVGSGLPPIGNVGDFPLTKEAFDKFANANPTAAELPETMKLQFIDTGAIRQVVQQGLLLVYAKSQGIQFSDGDIKQAALAQLQKEYKQKLVDAGKLSPGATQQDFENAFKAATGKSWLEGVKEMTQDFDTKMQEQTFKMELLGDVAPSLVLDKIKSKYAPTDDQLKAQFDTYHFKVITFAKPKATAKQMDASAAEAEKAVKGGLSFEAAMDKYSATPAEKGKKVSDKITDLLKEQIDSDPSLKPLLSLKPGEVSAPIQGRGGPSIYKFINHAVDVPKNFDLTKGQMANDLANRNAGKAVGQEIEKLQNTTPVTWSSEGFHVLYDYAKSGATADAKTKSSLLDRAMAATSDPIGGGEAAGVAMILMPDVIKGLPVDKANELKLKVLEAYLGSFPQDIDAKVQLAEAYIAAGDAVHVASTMKDIADVNSIHTDDTGKQVWDKMLKAIPVAQGKKLLSVDDAKILNDDYKKWLEGYNAAQTEKKKEEADMKAAQEKAKAEQAKADKAKAAAPAGQKGASSNSKPNDTKKGPSSILNPSGSGKTGN